MLDGTEIVLFVYKSQPPQRQKPYVLCYSKLSSLLHLTPFHNFTFFSETSFIFSLFSQTSNNPILVLSALDCLLRQRACLNGKKLVPCSQYFIFFVIY